MSENGTSAAQSEGGLAGRFGAGMTHRVLRLLGSQQFVLLVVLLLMIFVFTSINPRFFSLGVFGNILVNWAPIALIAVGQTFVIVSGGIDLSVGSTMTISGVVAAIAMRAATEGGAADGASLFLGIVTAAGIGLLVGLVNALLINQARLVPFIATLATLGAGAGLSLVLTKGGPVAGGPASAIALSVPWLGPLSWPGIVVVLVIIVAGLFLHKSRFGRYVFAIGGNAFAATAVGISVKTQITKVYAISGLLAGMGGLVLYLTLGSGSPSAGSGQELLAIAAVVIGGASLTGGVGRMSGTVIGSLILTTVTSGLIIINIDPNWNQVVVAILIATAVTLQILRRGQGRKA